MSAVVAVTLLVCDICCTAPVLCPALLHYLRGHRTDSCSATAVSKRGFQPVARLDNLQFVL